MKLADKPIAAVVAQHVDEVIDLRSLRGSQVRAPHVGLERLARLDERIRAHLDGVAVAGREGLAMAQETLSSAGVGEVFLVAVRALEQGDEKTLDDLISLIGGLPDALTGLGSAIGWVSASSLKGFVATWLADADPRRQFLGLVACSLHRVDPGPNLALFMDSPVVMLRARALRCAGEVGRRDLMPQCIAHLHDDEAACRFAAAQSAVLLGDRERALSQLAAFAMQPGPYRVAALALALFAADQAGARTLVGQIARQREDLALLARVVGFAGDAERVPWLIGLMDDTAVARVAGEAFGFITGVDLAERDLERAGSSPATGPDDDPESESVEMDADEDLPWPDRQRVSDWWSVHAADYPVGTRLLFGERPAVAVCERVLREGGQRWRFVAALNRCLCAPGSVLFNCVAPAWRQQRLLRRLSVDQS